MSSTHAEPTATSDKSSSDAALRAPRRAHFIRAALVGLFAGLLAVAFRRALALAEAGKRVTQTGLPPGCLIIAIERGGSKLLPTAKTILRAGDHLSILTPGDQPQTPLEIVRLCTGL